MRFKFHYTREAGRLTTFVHLLISSGLMTRQKTDPHVNPTRTLPNFGEGLSDRPRILALDAHSRIEHVFSPVLKMGAGHGCHPQLRLGEVEPLCGPFFFPKIGGDRGG